MPSNLRRLAADHAALHSSHLPPYYLLPPDDGRFAAADDLSQLTVLLTGPPGTPYAQGLWRLHLKMPEDYPHSPPKATFRTRIWHPNMEELTGAVCVDTLKRDWDSKLTLRDVLITISCLLIHPNPDSALNSSAGNLLREDYEAFAHQAKLMASIHAPIPTALRSAVQEAQSRGDDVRSSSREKGDETQYQRPRKQQRIHRGTPKKTARRTSSPTHFPHAARDLTDVGQRTSEDENMGDSENDDPASASKENNPSLSPTPVRLAPSQRKNALGKRPLSILAMPYPEDPDTEMMLVDSDPEPGPEISPASSTSEQNIAANALYSRKSASPQRKPPKLPLRRGNNTPTRLRPDLPIYEDVPDRTRSDSARGFNGIDKRHYPEIHNTNPPPAVPSGHRQNGFPAATPQPGLHPPKVPKKGFGGPRKAGAPRPKPRIGVRRL
ncbi:Ubiquitin-conjugating enzyme E2 [Penicillium capsulatum]|uniref:Ubiquitin-conjugating enzyme E2 n=1 Tax=Penicillium capsulatum TaxID=69766 RepID=A0A9W9IK54_9EURO|nr:Ubiquitin-conjugating enzyme E2 [Penicillium capsulatum]KAJ6121593.1 Ubiquitin-conjugating enzyme E2 [Penicillium capsulatum]